ncbi:hypothetical protein R1flu_011589 [Riccia fluitans]|uniref:Uncharacterized protein n=1 Tax=Riccia fluitans TaxID=41844 RepID=A0ABD1ZBI4_9MARC
MASHGDVLTGDFDPSWLTATRGDEFSAADSSSWTQIGGVANMVTLHIQSRHLSAAEPRGATFCGPGDGD